MIARALLLAVGLTMLIGFAVLFWFDWRATRRQKHHDKLLLDVQAAIKRKQFLQAEQDKIVAGMEEALQADDLGVTFMDAATREAVERIVSEHHKHREDEG